MELLRNQLWTGAVIGLSIALGVWGETLLNPPISIRIVSLVTWAALVLLGWHHWLLRRQLQRMKAQLIDVLTLQANFTRAAGQHLSDKAQSTIGSVERSLRSEITKLELNDEI